MSDNEMDYDATEWLHRYAYRKDTKSPSGGYHVYGVDSELHKASLIIDQLRARIAELEAEVERERQYANNAVKETVSEVRRLETENARMRTALQKISDDSPATCEMSPAHDMGQTANEALQQIAADAPDMGLYGRDG